MKQHIEWVKDKLAIHVYMTVGEAFVISACIASLLIILIIYIAHNL